MKKITPEMWNITISIVLAGLIAGGAYLQSGQLFTWYGLSSAVIVGGVNYVTTHKAQINKILFKLPPGTEVGLATVTPVAGPLGSAVTTATAVSITPTPVTTLESGGENGTNAPQAGA